jgi:hypothetical protein
MTESINLVFKIDGRDLEKGLSVLEVSSILNSFNQLMQESSKTLNPAGPDIQIKVKPFIEGSFGIDFILGFLQTAQATISPLGPEGIAQIIETLKLIGVIAGEDMSLLALIKKLKGSPKKVIEAQGGKYNYISQGDESFEVNGGVHLLIQNPVINTTINNTYVEPFKDENVEKINSYIKDEEEKTNSEVNAEEAESIAKFTTPPSATPVEPRIIEQEIVILIHPKRVDMEGDGKKWTFREVGGEILIATIRHKSFLEEVAQGKIRLNQSDTLEVKLHKTQKINEDRSEITSNEILEVIKYTKGPDNLGQTSFLE